MTKSPAFQFYPKDFLSDENVMLMSNQELGCYIKLISFCWIEGSIPSDIKNIAKLCGEDASVMSQLWQSIEKCFIAGEKGRLDQPRIKAEKIKQQEYRSIKSASGINGASSKWGETSNKTPGRIRSERLAAARALGTHTADEWKVLVSVCGNKCVKCGNSESTIVKDHIKPLYQGGSDSIDNLQPMCCSCNSRKGPEAKDYRPSDWKTRLANAWQMPSSSSASSSASSTADNTYIRHFDEFWAGYPKKVGKVDAFKVWKKLKPDLDLVSKILSAIENQKSCAQWNKDGGQFIPNPSTWLNQGRWDDEAPKTEAIADSWANYAKDQGLKINDNHN